MKMTNHHKRKVERMSLDEVGNVANVAKAVNVVEVVEAAEVANVEEIADVEEAGVVEAASVEEATNVAKDKVLEKVMNCSGYMERYIILLKGKQLLATFLPFALHVAPPYALNRPLHLSKYCSCFSQKLFLKRLSVKLRYLQLRKKRILNSAMKNC
jgi:hypothetical protein